MEMINIEARNLSIQRPNSVIESLTMKKFQAMKHNDQSNQNNRNIRYLKLDEHINKVHPNKDAFNVHG